MRVTRREVMIAVLLCLGAMSTGGVEALPLGLIEQNPDITVPGNLAVSLTPQLGGFLFTAATPVPLAGLDLFNFKDAGGADHFLTNANYVLLANVDGAGQLLSGTLDISGSVPDLGIATGTLLHATLTSFGFSPDPNPGSQTGLFELVGNVTISAAGLGYGAYVGGKVDAYDLPVTWSMTLPFTGFTGSAYSDTFARVPQPASLLLVGVGLALAWARHRRRR